MPGTFKSKQSVIAADDPVIDQKEGIGLLDNYCLGFRVSVKHFDKFHAFCASVIIIIQDRGLSVECQCELLRHHIRSENLHGSSKIV